MDYKIIVYDGLSPDRFIFSGNSLSNKKLYLLYDAGYYDVITNSKAAIAKKYTCEIKLAPYVRRHHPVLKIKVLCFMEHVVSQ